MFPSSNDNATSFDLLVSFWHSITSFWSDLFGSLDVNPNIVTFELENLPFSLEFTEFQLKLLWGFLITLIINLLLVFIAWTIYGKGICERFMKPATSKAIEELKASVSKLKLPKEHTPRI